MLKNRVSLDSRNTVFRQSEDGKRCRPSNVLIFIFYCFGIGKYTIGFAVICLNLIGIFLDLLCRGSSARKN